MPAAGWREGRRKGKRVSWDLGSARSPRPPLPSAPSFSHPPARRSNALLPRVRGGLAKGCACVPDRDGTEGNGGGNRKRQEGEESSSRASFRLLPSREVSRAQCIIELELIYNDTNRRVEGGGLREKEGRYGRISRAPHSTLSLCLSVSLSLSLSLSFFLFSSQPSRRPTHSRSIVAGGGGTFLPGEVVRGRGRVHRKAGRSGTRARARVHRKRVQLASDSRRCESRSPLPSCFGGITRDGTHHTAHTRTHT